jgi:hypothetical protein
VLLHPNRVLDRYRHSMDLWMFEANLRICPPVRKYLQLIDPKEQIKHTFGDICVLLKAKDLAPLFIKQKKNRVRAGVTSLQDLHRLFSVAVSN